MNQIDRFFTEDIEQFSESYLSYLKEIIDKINFSEIRSFVEILLTARESGATIFLLVMAVVLQQLATLLMIWRLARMSIRNRSKY